MANGLLSASPFYGPGLKIERANHHIADLEGVFRCHIDEHVKPAMARPHAHKGEKGVTRLSVALPPHTATIIGDIVHNLRASLDYAYWVTVEANGGTFDRYVKFPFGKDRPSVRGSINGMKSSSKPNGKVINFIIDDMQPFEGGANRIYDLHNLDIMDKHKVLLPTAAKFSIPQGSDLIFNLIGTHPRRITNGSFIVKEGVTDTLFLVKNGTIHYTGNLYDDFTVVFGEGPLDGMPILHTLRSISLSISKALTALRDCL